VAAACTSPEALADLHFARGYARFEVALGAVTDLGAKGVLGIEVGGDDHIAGGWSLVDACTEKAVDLDAGGDSGALANQVLASFAGLSLAPSLLGLRSRRAGTSKFCLGEAESCCVGAVHEVVKVAQTAAILGKLDNLDAITGWGCRGFLGGSAAQALYVANSAAEGGEQLGVLVCGVGGQGVVGDLSLVATGGGRRRGRSSGVAGAGRGRITTSS